MGKGSGMSYLKDREWSDVFIKRAMHIMCEAAPKWMSVESRVAPEIEDQEHATDFLVLKRQDVRAACRIRRYHAWMWDKRDRDFTLRCWRKTGAKTELEKIIEGWADYLFYGFSTADGSDIHAWAIGDLDCFRKAWAGGYHGQYHENKGGTTGFRSFKWLAYPGLLVDYHNLAWDPSGVYRERGCA